MTSTSQSDDKSTTLTFPSVVHRRMAEAALQRDSDVQHARRDVEQALNLMRGERLGNVIVIDPDTAVVEVITQGSPTLYGVLQASGSDFNRFYTVDEALLRAVELRNGGGANSHGHIYAARALGVTPTVDAQR